MKLSLFIRISIISILTIVPIFQASAQSQQRGGNKPDNRPRTASVSGRVTIGGKPAVNARVSLDEIKDGRMRGGADVAVDVSGRVSSAFGGMNEGEDSYALTDADGRYRLINLPAGSYEARVNLKAYIAEKKTGENDLARSISLDDGETINDLDFSLVRGGVITGRVTDAEGQPMISGRVQLQIVTEGGQRLPYENYSSMQMFETDDRGVYRIYGLRAGRYLVSAGGESGFDLLGLSGAKHHRTWHPDTDDENRAKVVDLKEGGEATGIDIKFGDSKRTFEASGRVIDDATGQPIPKINVMCIQTGGDGVSFGGFNGQATTDAQGNFRFNGLTPGSYQVVMINLSALLSGGENKHYSDPATFEVKMSDVENVEIKARIGASISGVVAFDGVSDESVRATLAQSFITYMSKQERSDDPRPDSPFVFGGGMPTMIKGDGNFQITGIRPGKVTFMISNMKGEQLLVVRVERNGADAGDGIEVKAGENITGVRVMVTIDLKKKQ
ncbi:MAG TPA: carboxypeptidase-like regulatory domain-containing protein [Blastocatellia bacterium]|nr:carboxypeptidase-like regulatory domain-containing protein [Blastocatellia bacterium]